MTNDNPINSLSLMVVMEADPPRRTVGVTAIITAIQLVEVVPHLLEVVVRGHMDQAGTLITEVATVQNSLQDTIIKAAMAALPLPRTITTPAEVDMVMVITAEADTHQTLLLHTQVSSLTDTPGAGAEIGAGDVGVDTDIFTGDGLSYDTVLHSVLMSI